MKHYIVVKTDEGPKPNWAVCQFMNMKGKGRDYFTVLSRHGSKESADAEINRVMGEDY